MTTENVTNLNNDSINMSCKSNVENKMNGQQKIMCNTNNSVEDSGTEGDSANKTSVNGKWLKNLSAFILTDSSDQVSNDLFDKKLNSHRKSLKNYKVLKDPSVFMSSDDIQNVSVNDHKTSEVIGKKKNDKVLKDPSVFMLSDDIENVSVNDPKTSEVIGKGKNDKVLKDPSVFMLSDDIQNVSVNDPKTSEVIRKANKSKVLKDPSVFMLSDDIQNVSVNDPKTSEVIRKMNNSKVLKDPSVFMLSDDMQNVSVNDLKTSEVIRKTNNSKVLKDPSVFMLSDDIQNVSINDPKTSEVIGKAKNIIKQFSERLKKNSNSELLENLGRKIEMDVVDTCNQSINKDASVINKSKNVSSSVNECKKTSKMSADESLGNLSDSEKTNLSMEVEEIQTILSKIKHVKNSQKSEVLLNSTESKSQTLLNSFLVKPKTLADKRRKLIELEEEKNRTKKVKSDKRVLEFDVDLKSRILSDGSKSELKQCTLGSFTIGKDHECNLEKTRQKNCTRSDAVNLGILSSDENENTPLAVRLLNLSPSSSSSMDNEPLINLKKLSFNRDPSPSKSQQSYCNKLRERNHTIPNNVVINNKKEPLKIKKKLKKKNRNLLKRKLKNAVYNFPLPKRLNFDFMSCLKKQSIIDAISLCNKHNPKLLMTLDIGYQRPLYEEQFNNLQFIRPNDTIIDKDWAKFSVGALLNKKEPKKIKRFVVPVFYPSLIVLMYNFEEINKLIGKRLNSSLKVLPKKVNLSTALNQGTKITSVKRYSPIKNLSPNTKINRNNSNKSSTLNLSSINTVAKLSNNTNASLKLPAPSEIKISSDICKNYSNKYFGTTKADIIDNLSADESDSLSICSNSEISDSSPSKQRNFSSRIIQNGHNLCSGKARRVGLELKRLNADFIELNENADRNLETSDDNSSVHSSFSQSENSTKLLPPDNVLGKLAKVEREYHQTIMKSKDSIIFVTPFGERNKRVRKVPKKYLDSVVFDEAGTKFKDNIEKKSDVIEPSRSTSPSKDMSENFNISSNIDQIIQHKNLQDVQICSSNNNNETITKMSESECIRNDVVITESSHSKDSVSQINNKVQSTSDLRSSKKVFMKSILKTSQDALHSKSTTAPTESKNSRNKNISTCQTNNRVPSLGELSSRITNRMTFQTNHEVTNPFKSPKKSIELSPKKVLKKNRIYLPNSKSLFEKHKLKNATVLLDKLVFKTNIPIWCLFHSTYNCPCLKFTTLKHGKALLSRNVAKKKTNPPVKLRKIVFSSNKVNKFDVDNVKQNSSNSLPSVDNVGDQEMMPRIETVMSLPPEQFLNNDTPNLDDSVISIDDNDSDVELNINAPSSENASQINHENVRKNRNGLKFFFVSINSSFTHIKFLGGIIPVVIARRKLSEVLKDSVKNRRFSYKVLHKVNYNPRNFKMNFGVYASPRNGIFFGPYTRDEPHQLEAYRFVKEVKETITGQKIQETYLKLIPFTPANLSNSNNVVGYWAFIVNDRRYGNNPSEVSTSTTSCKPRVTNTVTSVNADAVPSTASDNCNPVVNIGTSQVNVESKSSQNKILLKKSQQIEQYRQYIPPTSSTCIIADGQLSVSPKNTLIRTNPTEGMLKTKTTRHDETNNELESNCNTVVKTKKIPYVVTIDSEGNIKPVTLFKLTDDTDGSHYYSFKQPSNINKDNVTDNKLPKISISKDNPVFKIKISDDVDSKIKEQTKLNKVIINANSNTATNSNVSQTGTKIIPKNKINQNISGVRGVSLLKPSQPFNKGGLKRGSLINSGNSNKRFKVCDCQHSFSPNANDKSLGGLKRSSLINSGNIVNKNGFNACDSQCSFSPNTNDNSDEPAAVSSESNFSLPKSLIISTKPISTDDEISKKKENLLHISIIKSQTSINKSAESNKKFNIYSLLNKPSTSRESSTSSSSIPDQLLSTKTDSNTKMCFRKLEIPSVVINDTEESNEISYESTTTTGDQSDQLLTTQSSSLHVPNDFDLVTASSNLRLSSADLTPGILESYGIHFSNDF